jgi:hypothetical protein
VISKLRHGVRHDRQDRDRGENHLFSDVKTKPGKGSTRMVRIYRSRNTVVFLFFLLDTGSAEFLNTLGLVVNFSNLFEEYHHPVGQGLRW